MHSLETPVFFTDPGPSPSLAFLTAWTFVLAASFLVFGLARSAVHATTPPLTVGGKEMAFVPLWWVRRLYLCVASWMVFDMVHRLFSYLFLPLRVLWRRHMLPLPHGTFASLVNYIRLSTLCFVKESDGRSMWTDWELPVISSVHHYDKDPVEISSSTPSVVAEGKSHMSDEEWECCQGVALASLVTVVMIMVFISRGLFSVFPMNMNTRKGDNEEEENGKIETTSEEDMSSEWDEDENWWSLGEPDDACLVSPEATAEEERLQSMEEQEQISSRHCQGKEKSGKRIRSLELIFRECWPVLLSVCYAALYAFTGGLPLLMRLVYPTCVVLVTLCGMIA